MAAELSWHSLRASLTPATREHHHLVVKHEFGFMRVCRDPSGLGKATHLLSWNSKCLPYTEPCSSAAPLANAALGALPDVELLYRNEECAGSCHHGGESDVPLLMLAEAPAGAWSVLQGSGTHAHPAIGALWPLGHLTILCKPFFLKH